MKNTILIFMFLSLFTSCANTYNKIANEPSIRPTHGGQLLEGKDYYLEVVGTEEKVEIYPLKYDKDEKKLVSVPLKDLDIEATYSYLQHEKKEGKDERPTPKGASSIPLDVMADGYEGKVKAKNTEGYVVNIKLQDNNDKEIFRYQVEM